MGAVVREMLCEITGGGHRVPPTRLQGDPEEHRDGTKAPGTTRGISLCRDRRPRLDISRKSGSSRATARCFRVRVVREPEPQATGGRDVDAASVLTIATARVRTAEAAWILTGSRKPPGPSRARLQIMQLYEMAVSRGAAGSVPALGPRPDLSPRGRARRTSKPACCRCGRRVTRIASPALATKPPKSITTTGAGPPVAGRGEHGATAHIALGAGDGDGDPTGSISTTIVTSSCGAVSSALAGGGTTTSIAAGHSASASASDERLDHALTAFRRAYRHLASLPRERF